MASSAAPAPDVNPLLDWLPRASRLADTGSRPPSDPDPFFVSLGCAALIVAAAVLAVCLALAYHLVSHAG